MKHLPHIFPLGDGAATISLGNEISDVLNGKVLAMEQWLAEHRFEGILDLITAYSSLTLVYDPFWVRSRQQPSGTVYEWVRDQLVTAWKQSGDSVSGTPVQQRIPVCYGGTLGPDLDSLAGSKGITPEELIRLHTDAVYKVYMIGFLPGFAYMGGLNPGLAAPRKEKPATVLPGSVGIAGSQTGIYPLQSPGGWQIIGRTPLRLFNAQSENPVLLKAGDEVIFYPISSKEWEDAIKALS